MTEMNKIILDDDESLSSWKKWNRLLKELRNKYGAEKVAELRVNNTPEQVAEILAN